MKASRDNSPAMPFRTVRTVVSLCGVIVLGTFLLTDYLSDPVREEVSAERALSREWNAANVERYAEALVGVQRYDQSLVFFLALISELEDDSRHVRRLAEVFDEWYDSLDPQGSAREALRVAGTAYHELAKYPALVEVHGRWAVVVDALVRKDVGDPLEQGRILVAFDRWSRAAKSFPKISAVDDLRGAVVEPARFALQDRLNDKVRVQSWSEAARYLELLRELDPADPLVELHGGRIWNGVFEEAKRLGDDAGGRVAAEKLIEWDPGHAGARAFLDESSPGAARD